jgi:DNA-binding XRE family transcriptional regulator
MARSKYNPNPPTAAKIAASRANGKLGGKLPTMSQHRKIAALTNLLECGFTETEAAQKLGVRRETVWQWKKDDRRVANAVKKGRDKLTQRVESALAHKALGMVLPDSHVSNYQGVVTVTPLEKHLAPDTLAQIFFLKNRAPDRWCDRTETSQTVTVAGLPEAVSERIRALARQKNLKPAQGQVIDVPASPEPANEAPPTQRLWSEY